MSDQYNHNTEITKNILKDIEEHGVHIAFVDTVGYSPGFGYSIGLQKNFGHPELVIIGLPPETIGAIINRARYEIENGTTYLTGVSYDGFLHGYPMQFLKVELEHYRDYVGYAGWYNDNSFDFALLQVIWPDKENKFPWEDGFNQNLKFQQPLLDRNTNFKFLEERNLAVFTSSKVLEGASIRYVYHDEDGDWQFHATADPDLNQAKIVHLEELVKMDPSLNEIYYLNFGESAERDSINSPWKVLGTN